MVESSYSPETSGASYRIGDWTLCTRTNSLVREAGHVELESRLVHLLLTFIDHQGQVLAKDWLLKTVWAGRTVTDESLLVAVSQLRKALGDDTRAPTYIKTVPGKGYQLIADAGRIAATVKAPVFQRIRWGVVLAVGLVLFGVGLAVYHQMRPSWPARLKATERVLYAGDMTRMRKVVSDLDDLAAEAPSARVFTDLALAKTRLMGDALVEPGNCREVIGLLDKAVALNARFDRAYHYRADARFRCRHDVAGAEADYRTAIRLRPSADLTMINYSGLLLAQERYADSLEQIREAQRANPLHYSTPMVVWLYLMHGKDDLASSELRRMERGGADTRNFHVSAMRVHAKAGRDTEAFSHLERVMRYEGFSAADIAEARAALDGGGLKAVFGWLLARRDTKDLGHYTPPLSWARYALATGDTEQAMVHLEQAFARNQPPLLWAGVDPAYAPVRNDPRFKAWLIRFRQKLN